MLRICSDTHIAALWDLIEPTVGRECDYLNPNEMFRCAVKDLKRNDVLVINGDIVDYYCAEYSGKGGSNYQVLNDILNGCKAKVYLNLGNHDYRSLPYNVGIYGLRHVNIPDKLQRKHAARIGFNAFRFLSELKSLSVNLKSKNTLKEYPYPHFYKAVAGNVQLIFLSTGPDALTRLPNYLKLSNISLLLSGHPAASGLARAQLDFLSEALNCSRAKENVIFLHCPPFFSVKPVKPIALNMRNLGKSLRGLRYSVFLDNRDEFLRLLLASRKNIIVITSHVHMPKQYIIDRSTLVLRESSLQEINKLRDNPRYIKFVSTLPLGGIGRTNKKVGYLDVGREFAYRMINQY